MDKFLETQITETELPRIEHLNRPKRREYISNEKNFPQRKDHDQMALPVNSTS